LDRKEKFSIAPKLVTKKQKLRLELALSQGGKCRYCKRFMTDDCGIDSDITIEHLTPLVHGGKKGRSNLAATCRRCNNEKAGMDDDEYFLTILLRSDESDRPFEFLESTKTELNASELELLHIIRRTVGAPRHKNIGL
jgi:hypothetical protein